VVKFILRLSSDDENDGHDKAVVELTPESAGLLIRMRDVFNAASLVSPVVVDQIDFIGPVDMRVVAVGGDGICDDDIRDDPPTVDDACADPNAGRAASVPRRLMAVAALVGVQAVPAWFQINACPSDGAAAETFRPLILSTVRPPMAPETSPAAAMGTHEAAGAKVASHASTCPFVGVGATTGLPWSFAIRFAALDPVTSPARTIGGIASAIEDISRWGSRATPSKPYCGSTRFHCVPLNTKTATSPALSRTHVEAPSMVFPFPEIVTFRVDAPPVASATAKTAGVTGEDGALIAHVIADVSRPT
jgi:hypothetical protein